MREADPLLKKGSAVHEEEDRGEKKGANDKF